MPTDKCEQIFSDTCNPHFGHNKKLYALEEHKILKLANKLKSFLNPRNIARTSLQHALSRSNKVLP